MRLLLLLSVMLYLSNPALAQLKLGLKVGLSTTNLSPSDLNILDENGTENLTLKLADANLGFHAGLVIQAQIGKFLLQPEVLFNSSSADYELTQVGQPATILNERYQYVDIPVLFGAKFGPLRLNLGPVGHIFINSTSEIADDESFNYEQAFDSMTVGYLLGAGLDIWNLMLDFRYEGNFTRFGDHINFFDQAYEFDESPARFLFSVAFTF